MTTFDKPVTKEELNQFYGRDVEDIEIDIAIGKAATEVDDSVYQEIVDKHYESIADNINDAYIVGQIIINARKQWIADCASFAVFGKEGLIKADEVNV